MRSTTFSVLTALALSLLTSFSLATEVSALSCPRATSLVAQDRPQGKEERCILERSGKRHGPFHTWYGNGNSKQEGTYRYGRPHGLWTYYYPNGQKRMEGSWRFGKVEGPWTYWYDNGSRESAGRFRAGKREGSWAYWDTTGRLRFEGNWTDGALDLEAGQAAAGKHAKQ